MSALSGTTSACGLARVTDINILLLGVTNLVADPNYTAPQPLGAGAIRPMFHSTNPVFNFFAAFKFRGILPPQWPIRRSSGSITPWLVFQLASDLPRISSLESDC